MKALLLVSGATAVAASALGAQVAPAKPDSACTTYPGGRIECRVYRGPGDSTRFRRIFYSMDSAMAKRAALGIEVRSTGSRRDTLGVFVDAVTPKGPAETAGIIEGDRIASINGVDLRTSAADTEDSYTAGLAAHRLTREVQKLTPGSRVNLRVWSNGRLRDVQVTAGKASEVMRLGNRMMMPGMGGMMRFEGPGGGAMMLTPDMPMLRERIEPLMRDMEPMLRERMAPLTRDMEPMLRERLRDLPNKFEMARPQRFKTFTPLRVLSPRIYKVEADAPDLEGEREEVSPMEIRELAATAIRDARAALAQLSAAEIA
jgi:hypothetical protein